MQSVLQLNIPQHDKRFDSALGHRPSTSGVALADGRYQRGRVIGTGSSASYGSGGGGGLNETQVIIIAVACFTALVLLVLGCWVCNWKKYQNPSGKFRDYFKRKNIPPAKRGEATLHETRGHGEDTVVPAPHDNPGVNLGSKFRNRRRLLGISPLAVPSPLCFVLP